MNSIKEKWLRLGLIILLILLIIFALLYQERILSYVSLFLEGETEIYSSYGYFEIPVNITPDIEPDLIPIDKREIANRENSGVLLDRTYIEYRDLAGKINVSIWDEDFDDWQISSFSAGWSCDDFNKEFSYLEYKFTRKGDYENGRSRYISTIRITSENESIFWHKSIIQSSVGKDSVLDLNEILPPEKALEIAENEGGEKIRISCDSKCIIFAQMEDQTWTINYYDFPKGNESSKLYSIQIDGFTGKIIDVYNFSE